MSRPFYRPEDALLAGVCAESARRLGWSVWAIRALVVLGLLLAPLAVGAGYALLALAMGLLLGGSDPKSAPPGGLASDRLSERGRRIAELEKKFNELDRDSG